MKRQNQSYLLAAMLVLTLARPLQAGNLTIEKVNTALQGDIEQVSIGVDNLGFRAAGFDLLLSVNQYGAGVVHIMPGEHLSNCGWEYFRYHVAHDSTAPFGLFRLTDYLHVQGIATTSGTTPECGGINDNLELVRIRFLVTNRRDFECYPVPVRFYWEDCYDNVVYSEDGATMHLADTLVDPFGRAEYYPYPGHGLPDASCDALPGLTVVRDLALFDGGMDLACTGKASHYSGDLNLNGFRFEVSDAVLYSSYFLYGAGVFTVNFDGQVAASDVDADGLPLTFQDLVLMLRIINGDYVLGQAKPSPNPLEAAVRVSLSEGGSELRVENDVALAGLYVRSVPAKSEPVEAALVREAETSGARGRIGDTMTVMLLKPDVSTVLAPGVHTVAEFSGPVRLTDTQALDREGRAVRIENLDASLPGGFALYQNYPNPFNPSTRIAFYLPNEQAWELTVFSIDGRQVRSFAGAGFGRQEVLWDGTDHSGAAVASGVYVYRVSTRQGTASKKMLLVK